MAEDFTQRATCKRYYKFENAADLGEDNQGTLSLVNNNAVTQSATIPSGTYASPSATKSADFESSSSQYLSATHANSTDIDDLTAITLVFWMKGEVLSGTMSLFEKGAYAADGWHYISFGNGDYRRFRFASAAPEIYSPAMADGTWYFVACTYSQTTDLLIIYQGTEETQASLIASNAGTDLTASTAGGFGIGAYAHGSNYYDGLICEPAILGEALSLAEIREIQVDGMEGTAAGNPYYAYAQQ